MRKKYFWHLAATGLLLTVIGCKQEKETTPEHVAKIRTMQPVERDFEETVKVQGNVQSILTAQISSRTDGILDLLEVDEGDRVQSGDLLFQVDKVNLENAVSVQKQRVIVAEANLTSAVIGESVAEAVKVKADKDAQRAEQLISSRAISENAQENAILNQQQADANVQQAVANKAHAQALLEQEKCSLDIATKQLADSMIRAPFDGVVKTKYRDRNEYVKSGDPIVYLEDPDNLEVSVFISANYYNRIEPGKTMVRVRNEDLETVATVPITYRAPSVDKLTRTFEIKLTLPKLDPAASKLVSGMLCNLEIILRTGRGYGVPASAVLLRGSGERAVFSVRDGKAVTIPVRTDIQDGDWLELVDGDGLKDMPVVIEGQAFLNVNDKVEELQ